MAPDNRASEDWKDVSVLITGASGFVGRHLCARLQSFGAHVTAVVRRAEAAGELDVPRISIADVTDGERMRELFVETRPSHVYHLAALTGPSSGLEALDRYVHTNTVGTAAMIAAASAVRPHKMVVLGTSEEYGVDAPTPIREDCLARPRTPYGISKWLSTELCLAAARNGDLPVTVVRPFMLYGSGMNPRFFISQLVDASVKHMPFDMTAGAQGRDFVYLDDAVDGIVAASTCAALNGHVVNLCSGQERTLQEVCAMWEKVSGVKDVARLGVLPYRSHENFHLVGDGTKLRQATGWSPRIPLQEGLAALWEAARQRGNVAGFRRA